MIDHEHTLSVTRQAQLLDVSRAAVYYRATPMSARDLALMRLIDEIHLEQPHWGSRGILQMLLRDSRATDWIDRAQPLSRKHVATLMRRMGIEALCPKPGTSKRSRKPGHAVFAYLLRNVTIAQANHVWAMDTTYIPMQHGFVYLTAVIDVATRRVLAHKLCTTLEAYHAVEIIEQAIAKFGTPEIVNTDQGSQFTAFEFTGAIKKHGIKLSMDGKGAWRDNVFIERFWRTVKYERIYKRAYDTVSQARADIAEYIDDYNEQRPHSALAPVQTAHGMPVHQTPREAFDVSRAQYADKALKLAA
jgi:putative transposase